MPSLSSRAMSIAGSIGRSSGGESRRNSVRTESGRRESTYTEMADGERGMVLDIPQEKEKGMMKRLSSIMRRDSGAS